MSNTNHNILIISASTRKDRQSHKVSTALLRAIEKMDIANVRILDLMENPVAPYEQGFSAQSDPTDSLSHINEALETATGIIFVSPEYNGSYTGVLKNTLDHFPKSSYMRKPIGVVSVSAGGLGGMRAALNMQQLVLALFAIPSPSMLLTANVNELFDQEGNISDLGYQKRVNLFLEDYFWLADRLI